MSADLPTPNTEPSTDVIPWEKAIGDDTGFAAWAGPRTGNVYTMFEVYLRYHTGKIVTVSYDWMACDGVHSREGGAWRTSQKLPRWFKKWVQENGKGNRYGTQKSEVSA